MKRPKQIAIRDTDRVFVLTGAGISADSRAGEVLPRLFQSL
jgi:NAD-dependent SIR2 family protein deacetylase